MENVYEPEPDWEAMAKELLNAALLATHAFRETTEIIYGEGHDVALAAKVQLAQRALDAAITRAQSLMEKKS